VGFIDPEVVQDFLTECGELLDSLDSDLVLLESTPSDPGLLDQVFRALHTIKGSASFLELTNLVAIAHAAEDALNAARKGQVTLDRGAMDLLLSAVDILRGHFDQLRAGEALSAPDPQVVAGLRGVAGEKDAEAPAPGADGPAEASATQTAGGDAPSAEASGARVEPLVLPESKRDLLEFMVDDLLETLGKLRAQVEGLRDAADRRGAGEEIAEAAEALSRGVDFFECAQVTQLVQLIGLAGERIGDLDEEGVAQILPRLLGALSLLEEQGEALRRSELLTRPIDLLSGRVGDLLLGHALEPEGVLPADADAQAALAIDRVRTDAAAGAEDASPSLEAASGGEAAQTPPAEAAAPVDAEGAGAPGAEGAKSGGPAKVEQTIRIEVARLEAMLNLVGELVLQKNRIGALNRRMGVDGATQDLRESLLQASSDLERVTGDIQVAVMRARMQSLDRLFGKYPRLIRDLARKTGKNITLKITGGETEVDKSVLEELGDPLVHLLRNSADHGVETPERRREAGKPEQGVIHLRAAQHGDHVLVQISDDGAGLSRERLLKKAIERGIVTEQDAETMSDRDVYRLIFAAGFSTADEVSDISGRGVGMDVVRNNIEKLKGQIDLDSTPGEGTTISIRIPLTVAILPAMMVGVSGELYAVPLGNIVEIIRPTPDQISTINGRSVMTLRGSVLPLVSLSEALDAPRGAPGEEKFAVVVEQNDAQVGLLVTELIGQQEIVIKPLDELLEESGPVSGATVRDDGGVSLIVDIARLVEHAKQTQAAIEAAAA